MSISAAVDRILERIESAEVLDKPSEYLAAAVGKALPKGKLQDLVSGTPLGHPLHPVLVAIPIGSWTAASYLDATFGDRSAARKLVGFGVLAALPTALSGANDWATTAGAERRVGLVHALLNDVALALYTGSWLARRRGRHLRGAGLALAGATVLGAAGWLGGHLAYGLGIGVDTTAFQQFPEQWTDVAAEADVPASQGIAGDVEGVAVLLARHDGQIIALSDRCTHRGGPLHEGSIDAGCVTCPWHESVFALADGSVLSGPATRPQPVAEVRVVDGRVQVRRRSERTLRSNPVGH
ncbi:MAG: Rieske 2Fe-2S domain-containing protein [Actinomycetota bacterium]|nr:Rieske 2Fe-2S domain-containing protein [Actinomycetota bacterium]